MNERPDDCPDPSGNGGGCDALQRHVAEQSRFMRRLNAVEVSLATMKIVVDATREDARAVRAVVCGPANEVLAKYQSDHPPELLDADDGQDLPTETAIHVPWMAARKVQRERARASSAEQARVRLEAEKLLAERRAAELADQKTADDKRHKRLIALLAALAALGTAAYPTIQAIVKAMGH